MTNMWDLTGTYVAANYRKVRPSTQLGTRVLRFVKVVVAGGPDLVTGSNLSDSYFSQAVLAMQNYGETFMIGKPASLGGGSYAFCMVMSDDTIQDSAVDTNAVVVPGNWAQAEANVAEHLGSGTVTITDMYLSGDGFANVSTAADKT
jgi:hypothetical protein